MLHLGNILEIDGRTIPKVDVITFGAPCQDISVAGKRKGMLHVDKGDEETTRSGLFFEAIRIIKEMREDDRNNGRSDELLRPRFGIYENVPGAFSSNKGADFQTVLTEIVRIAEPEAPDVPMPDKNKWPKSGCIYDELGRWSVAWRVHDAQFWGVPQRRKRIALVADFGGLSAPEVLFERKGLCWHSEQSSKTGKGTAGDTKTGFGEPDKFTAGFKAGQSADGGIGFEEEQSPTLSAVPSALEPTVVYGEKPDTVNENEGYGE